MIIDWRFSKIFEELILVPTTYNYKPRNIRLRLNNTSTCSMSVSTNMLHSNWTVKVDVGKHGICITCRIASYILRINGMLSRKNFHAMVMKLRFQTNGDDERGGRELSVHKCISFRYADEDLFFVLPEWKLRKIAICGCINRGFVTEGGFLNFLCVFRVRNLDHG